MQRILLQYLVWFKNYNYKYIFLSEQIGYNFIDIC